MRRSVRLRLNDMLEAIEGIEMTVAGVTFPEYERSWPVRRAVERGVEIISEASRHVPEELKRQYPHIYWREIAGMAICCGTNTAGSTTESCGAWSRGICRS